MATENPSELLSLQLSRTCGMNLIIEIPSLMLEIKYSQSRNVKFPIHTKAPPATAATQAEAMRSLKSKEGCVG